MHDHMEQEPSLTRLELIGLLARACLLGLSEHDVADTVEYTVRFGPEGFSVDCTLATGQVPLVGWGQ